MTDAKIAYIQERNFAIVEERLRGDNLGKIGTRHCITRECARRICLRHLNEYKKTLKRSDYARRTFMKDEKVRSGAREALKAFEYALSKVLSQDNGEVLIDSLELSVRSHRILKSMGIKDLRELTSVSTQDLLRIPNFGRKSLNEVNAFLGEMGLEVGSAYRYKGVVK